MKKMRIKLQWNERTKMLLAAALSGAALLLAIFLPLAFFSPVKDDAPDTGAEQKAELFAQYWYAAEEESGVYSEKVAVPKQEMLTRCEETMRDIVSQWIYDAGIEYAAPSGSEYTRVQNETGEMTLCRMWLEEQGDWRNWLDVCFDAESGTLYYFYLSRECLRNQKIYGDNSGLTTELVAQRLAEFLHGNIRYFSAPDEAGACAAVISTPGGTICYSINCKAYDRLIDIKINCEE